MNKLRKRMIWIVFSAALFVFLLMSGLITTAIMAYNNSQADNLTSVISQNGGKLPQYRRHVIKETESSSESDTTTINIWEGMDENTQIKDGSMFSNLGFYGYNEETAFRTRYFVVHLKDDSVTEIDIEHIASVDESEAEKMAVEAIKNRGVVGYKGYFRYRIVRGDDSLYVIFLDCSENFYLLQLIGLLSLVVSMIFTLLITILFAAMSKRVVEPFEQNSKRQKQFITDASHELKTPLATISANAEVLEYKNGKNSWTQNIIDQTKEMSKLVNQLLVLAKLEEVGDDVVLEEIELSGLVREKAESFREVAVQKGVGLAFELPEVLKMTGNREQLAQLVSILTENATKYVTESGEIQISLKKIGRFAVLEVYNTAEVDGRIDYNRLFDRFYRTDQSRCSQTGGHGIGLSIAKRIVTRHNGRISAQIRGNGIAFKAELSMNLKPAGRRKRDLDRQK